jgi:rod shape-determining protein MreD
MKFRVYLLALLFIAPLQASLLSIFSLGGVTPDLGLAVLFAVGVLTGPVEGALAGIALGLMQDIAGAGLLGFAGITRGIIGLLAGLFGRRIMDVMNPAVALFLVGFSLLDQIITAIALEIIYGALPFFGLLFTRMIPQALYTALLGYLLLKYATRRPALDALRRQMLRKEA